MSLLEFLPTAECQNHIVAYWVLKPEPDKGNRIYADGCADLICNAGKTTVYFHPKEGLQQAIPLYPRQLYLGGTMSAYGVLKCDNEGFLTGIRFRPGGFYALFGQPMQEAVDSTIEFKEDELCKLMQDDKNYDERLDQWFNDRLASGKIPHPGPYDFVYLRNRMYESGGLASVETLATESFVSQSTLVRIFKKNVGIPPKEFLRIIRFQELLKRLRSAAKKEGSSVSTKESLLHTAFELGYYDHAHLTKEFKKYAGILPSELTNFYKTGISAGQYF